MATATTIIQSSPMSDVSMRAREAGGRGRPARPGAEGLQDIKDLLADLTSGVLSGEVTREVTIAANQLLNTSLRALELERKWKEVLELHARLEAVEGVLKDRERRRAG
jgi:hypothetical protein